MSAIPTPETAERRSRGSALPSEWRESLKSRMAMLRARVVRLLWLRAIGMLLILGVLGIVAAVAFDWSLRPARPVGRWGLSGLLAAWLAGLAVWFLRGSRQRRISTAAVARQLERLIPSLGDRLSSAVAMIQPRELDHQESELAEQAVQQAAEELQAVRPERTIDPAPALRMIFFASLLLSGLIAACVWRPATAGLAARRLIAPASDVAWPRRNHLELANVSERLHAGSDLEVFVRDLGGMLPDDTQVVVRDSEGQLFSPPLRMSGTAGAAKLERVAADFEIRAVGGDDETMPWRTVRVVAPPRITSYQIRLLPPEYLAREPQTLVGEQIRVMAGTQMWIEATVEPPVVEATFVNLAQDDAAREGAAQEGETPTADPEQVGALEEEPSVWPVTVDAQGSRIAAGPILLDRSGQFVFRWTDTEGLAGESRMRWRVEIDEDAVPRVAMVQPSEDTEVTAEGFVELKIVAEDDLGLAESWFEVQAAQTRAARFLPEPYADRPRERTRTIRARVEELLRSDPSQGGDAEEESAATDSRGLAAELSAELAPVQTIEIAGVALDIAGQRGESTVRRLRIVSREALRQTLAERQRAAMEPLRQAAREQTVAAEQTEVARGRLFGDDRQRAAAADRLRAAEAAQSAAQQRIVDGPDSVVDRLQAAVQMAADNGIDAAAMEELLAALETTAKESMQPASEQLDRSREELAEDDEEAAADAMDDAIVKQREAAEALNKIAQAMRRDDARRSAIEELAELQAAHARLSEASRQIAGAADARAEASRLAQQQRGLAREAERMTVRLQKLAEEMREQNPDVAAAAEQAAAALQQDSGASPQQSASVSDAMRAAASELERGREGRAGELQADVAEQLSAARRTLSGESGSQDSLAAESEDPLQAFATGLETLQSEQSTLVAALREQADASHSVAQEKLADRADTLADTATAPPGFSEALADASEEMRMAAALLRRSGSEAAAVDRAEAALARLELIAESLRGPADDPNENSPPNDSAEQDPNAEGEPQERSDDPVPLSTLRLVRATQDFLLARTEQIAAEEQETAAADREATADSLRRARLQAAKRALAEEQQRLVERIERYAQEMAAARANEPEESDVPAEN